MNIKLNINWHISKTKSLQQKVDPVLFELLAAIQHFGSLKRATDNINVSYRFAWGLLAKWEELLEQPLVILERGRGAKLSLAGESLFNANAQLLARFTPNLDNFSTQFTREFETILNRHKSDSLNIFASHGIAIGALRDLLNQQSLFKLDLHFHGSLDSLRALKTGRCDIAGFHIPIGPFANKLSAQYLDILDQEKHQLIYVVKRNQGLMFQAKNAQEISSLSSLVNKKLRFINRQIDSGTRLLFDQLLQAENIAASDINGYQNEEFTHMAIAAMIASDAADVGFGIAPIADKFNLEFIPLVWEHYCLAVPKQFAEDDHTQQISHLLQSDTFKEKLSGLPGYDASLSGKTVSFKEIFS